MRWSDIDLNARTVRIERSVSVTKAGGVAFKPTTTGNVRLVTLTTQAADALTDHHAHAQARRAGAISESAQVFTNDRPGLDPGGPNSRPGAGVIAAATSGSITSDSTTSDTSSRPNSSPRGIDVRTVSNRLGHARTSTTLDIYWAWVPAQDQHAAHHLELVLGQRV